MSWSESTEWLPLEEEAGMITRERLEVLILARLSVHSRHAPSLSNLTKSLHPFASRHVLANEWQASVDAALSSLRDLGHVDPKNLRLSDAGRARLAKALRLERPPAAKTWNDFKKRYLRVLLGQASNSGRAEPPLANAVVASELGVSTERATTDAALADAWLARSLSLPGGKVTLGPVKAALLARQLGVPVRKTVKEVLRLAAPKITGATSAKTDDLLQALAYRWLTSQSTDQPELAVPVQSSTGAPASLIHKIRAAANSPDAKHFSANKVFIGSVWQNLRSDPDLQPLGEAGFKQLLVEAHQRGDLTLSRADLVQAMDPGDVAASETQHLNATYHFIQVAGDQL
jgi:hypothetical protein